VTVEFIRALDDWGATTTVRTPAPAPAARQIVVVARTESRLHQHLAAALGQDPKIVLVRDRRRAAGGPPAGLVERRRPLTSRRDLRFRLVIVVPEERTPSQGGVPVMNNGDAGVPDDRQRVERWVEDSQYVIGRLIPGLLEDRDRWRSKAEAAEQEIDRLRAEIVVMRREIGRAMEHLTQMQQPLNDVLLRLGSMPPVLVEANGR
jgi:hypothetical protein